MATDVSYKRVNIRIPMELYSRLEAYCKTVNAPVASAICLFVQRELNQLDYENYNKKMSEYSEQLLTFAKSVSNLNDQVKDLKKVYEKTLSQK